jgi:hypothetical protein
MTTQPKKRRKTLPPKWLTPIRKAYLVKLFVDSNGFCVYGHKNCLIPAHHYEIYIERVIDSWKSEDREQARIDWLAEREAMHNLCERRYPITGRFNNISIDIFHASQPLFYLECLGIDGLRLQPFAKVKIGSSYMRLYVSLGDSLRTASKNQRRKAIRYGKGLPTSIQEQIRQKVWLAVRDYLDH